MTSRSIHFSRRGRFLFVLLAVGILGTYLLTASHAATNVVATEPETGSITAPAATAPPAQTNDATASGGKYVKFGTTATGGGGTGGSGTTTWGWQLTTSNTGLTGVGVTKTALPVYTGNCSPASGTTISNVQITCQMDLRGKSNITLDHVWLHPTGGLSRTDILYLGTGTVVKNSDIDGLSIPTSSPPRAGINASNTGFTIQNVYIQGVEVGIYMDEGTGTIDHTFINANLNISGNHTDGFTRRVGTGIVTISASRIIANVPGGTTGAFFLQDTIGQPVRGVTVKDSLLEGLGYVMTLESYRGGVVDVAANNVRINVYPVSDGYGPIGGVGVSSIIYNDWTKIYLYNAAAPMDADGGAKGAVVNHP